MSNWWETVDWQDPINRDCPLNAGIVGWWMGAPGLFGGTRLWDLTNRNHGTLTNMDPVTAWQTSERGPVLAVSDSAAQVVQCSDSPSHAFNGATGLTLMAMCYPTAFTNNPVIISKIKASSPWWMLRFFSDGDVACDLRDSALTRSENRADLNLAANQWYHIVGTYDGAVNRLYVNGVQRSTHSATLTTGIGLHDNGTRIGSDNEGREFIGLLHNCQIAGRTWSASEVAAHYRQSLTGFPDMLNHYRRRSIFLPPADTGNRRRRLLICGAA